ncbi:GNAT family N-acetyltransferase [Candidatus Micrarchaeota archaeon]|nr:GNAT family N-acetyltransferase [Candidatus Micrarchaeota archaeon]
MQIKKASKEDFAALEELIACIFPSVQLVQSERDVYFIAVQDGSAQDAKAQEKAQHVKAQEPKAQDVRAHGLQARDAGVQAGRETLMGFSHVRLPKDPSQGRFILQGLGVKNEFRLQGVGSALLAHCLSFCMQQGALEVQLCVKPLNPALSLYCRFGFFPKKQQKEDSMVLVRKMQT